VFLILGVHFWFLDWRIVFRDAVSLLLLVVVVRVQSGHLHFVPSNAK
jgi:hypothetical protein